ncbi:MAG: hypothetical protein ACPG4V_12960, partial [Limisphaerales bacterium]
KKDGVKFNLTKDALNLSVISTNSGDGNETLNVNSFSVFSLTFTYSKKGKITHLTLRWNTLSFPSS